MTPWKLVTPSRFSGTSRSHFDPTQSARLRPNLGRCFLLIRYSSKKRMRANLICPCKCRGGKSRLWCAATTRTGDASIESVITKWYGDNMIRTQISLDADVYAKAKGVARRMGVSVAELCRRGLQETLSRQPTSKPWMVYAGIVEGSPQDSGTVDEVVYGRSEP